jgi:hypothetical protein
MTMTKQPSDRADAANIKQWSDRATANSFHNSKENKAGGKPNEQTRANQWYEPRERGDYTGPAEYAGSKQDRGGK